jgi:hypothetical protein
MDVEFLFNKRKGPLVVVDLLPQNNPAIATTAADSPINEDGENQSEKDDSDSESSKSSDDSSSSDETIKIDVKKPSQEDISADDGTAMDTSEAPQIITRQRSQASHTQLFFQQDSVNPDDFFESTQQPRSSRNTDVGFEGTDLMHMPPSFTPEEDFIPSSRPTTTHPARASLRLRKSKSGFN